MKSNMCADKVIEILNDNFSGDSTSFTKSKRYSYNGKPVPRVTSILDSTISKPEIIRWANGLGFKHLQYNNVLRKAADIGTNTHEYIEKYIQNKNLPDISFAESNNCIETFKLWWDEFNKENTVKVLGEEEKLSCEWFGGTYDLLLEVNGKKVLLDFKTSNNIHITYFYQLAAYEYLINKKYNFKIDNFMIFRMDKKKHQTYETMVLDNNSKVGKEFMNSCKDTFFVLLLSYMYLNTSKLYFTPIYNTIERR